MGGVEDKIHVTHVEDVGHKVSEIADMSPEQVAEAYRASVAENKMGFWQALRIYKKGMFWSTVMSIVSWSVV